MQPHYKLKDTSAMEESSQQDSVWERKKAPVSTGVNELIRSRYSPRAFREQSLTEADLDCLLEAASWASSSANEQPWRYACALRSDQEAFQQFLDCLLPGNQGWAHRAGAILLCLAYTRHDAFNLDNPYAWHDCGAANTSLILQATHMGIGGRMMAGFDREKTIARFRPGKNIEPVCFIALGYPDAPDVLPSPYREKEMETRNRKTIDEIRYPMP